MLALAGLFQAITRLRDSAGLAGALGQITLRIDRLAAVAQFEDQVGVGVFGGGATTAQIEEHAAWRAYRSAHRHAFEGAHRCETSRQSRRACRARGERARACIGFQATRTRLVVREFHGRRTANGEHFDLHAMTAAHRTLPLGSYVRVTSLANSRSVVVRINDRGPYARGRVIDLSYLAATALGMHRAGVTKVKMERVEKPESERIAHRPMHLTTSG